MLYEVITMKITFGHGAAPGNPRTIAADKFAELVITSYSIHYTKLYEWKLRTFGRSVLDFSVLNE